MLKRLNFFLSARVSSLKAMAWATNALVEATEISGPAFKNKLPSSRAQMVEMAEPTTLQTDIESAPSEMAFSKAAKVSAVSPDCDTAITSVLLSVNVSRYLYSLAISTLTGIRNSDSIDGLAIIPA